MHRELVDRGLIIGRHRTARLMRVHGIRARSACKYRVTTDSNHSHPVAENILGRDFEAAPVNRKWSSDITYFPTRQGWLYLAVVGDVNRPIDLYSRRVVGWFTSRSLHRKLVLSALDEALARRRPELELIHHSDRGSQYASEEYRARLREMNITCSMSHKGDCWDNAVVESFFATLKKELVHGADVRTREEKRSELFEYIELFYN